ncbi:MAG: amidohydrolase family protein [Bacilli bacterium]|nr:amidohydrolase family protein [Bacilli bacterium]MBN2696832.1 amidohydrolase family protein [Bacilli bacterium]
MVDKAIVNGQVYQDGHWVKTNVYISGEKIYAITKDHYLAKEVIDATGLLVLPGLIDPHVHFDLDLGYIRSVDDFERGSMIAALGGVTTIIDFLEPVDNEKDLEKAYRKRLFEAEDSYIDFKFHACIKNPVCDLEVFVRKMSELGMNTLKCFTTYSDSGRMTSDETIIELLKLSEKYKFLLLVHAEDDSLIRLDPELMFRDLPVSRPKAAEINKAVQLIGYVAKYGGYLYMVHVSSGETIERLKEIHVELLNRKFFIESCPQYFLFDSSRLLQDDGYLYTTAPPLRTKTEQMYLRSNIDWVHVIGTDHCAFTSDQKAHEYLYEIPLGVGSIEHSFGVMHQMFGDKVIDKMSKNIALLHRIESQKGRLKVGLDADIILYKLEQSVIDSDHSNSDYSIYSGTQRSGIVMSTLIRGEFVVRDRNIERTFGRLVKGDGF